MSRPFVLTIVVLGDIGRSPRMQYHALAAAELSPDSQVQLVGYAQSAPLEQFARHARIRVCPLAPFELPEALTRSKWLYGCCASVRFLLIGMHLLWFLLFASRRPSVMLVQSPPAFPTVILSVLAAKLRGARMIVDWHNFGYSLLALRLGGESVAVRVAKWLEHRTGALADEHLCVSEAMAKRLRERWPGASVRVFADRPAEHFHPVSNDERGRLRGELAAFIAPKSVSRDCSADSLEQDALLVSATSWSLDEPLDMLLDTLASLDRMLAERDPSGYPFFRFVVTGRGPGRAAFDARREQLSFVHSSVVTAWLPAGEYARLLSAADLGLSFHRSASGLDPAMKVWDMLGSGLPIAALDHGDCLDEQFDAEVNGVVFDSPCALANRILDLFEGFPVRADRLQSMRQATLGSRPESFQSAWRKRVAPLPGFAG